MITFSYESGFNILNITKLANVCFMCGANLEIHKIISGNWKSYSAFWFSILVNKYLDGTNNVAMVMMNVIKLN